MEALTGQRAGDGGSSVLPAAPGAVPAPASLAAAIAVVRAVVAAAPDQLAMAGYLDAAEYAGNVEELSRNVDCLQILAAGTVDRTRTRAITDATTARTTRTWTTSWNNGTENLNETDTNWPGGPANDGTTLAGAGRIVPGSPADDGCNTTAEFLRVRLRIGIGIGEAKRRLHLAAALSPTTPCTGPETPTPAGPQECTSPTVSSRAGTIISTTLDRLKHHTTPETLDRIEHDLTRTATTTDPDFVARVARRWAETLDADGTEPSEEALRHTQGAFIRKPRHGLHHLEIFATTDQYEHFATIMNAATSPRTSQNSNPGTGTGTSTDAGTSQHTGVWQDKDINLDRRTRPQKQLDGIITAFKAALTTNKLPTAGGNRPQIIATINHHDLLPHHPTTTPGTGGPNTGTGTGGPNTGTGNYIFTGPVAATTLRKLACDADIIPALLGTHGEILDLGRKTRLFTPTQRLALTARDQGCTFPNCTIPAPWCEAHHITYWSHNGPTTVNNGTLLCPHHHLIHKEQWTIHTTNNTPWFTPPPHIDPTQKPQQNHYFKPPPPPQRE